MVHDAESGLCEAIGVAPDIRFKVQSIDHETIPASLGDDVERLTDDAVKKRPDIAAQIAAVRAGDAAIDRAQVGVLSRSRSKRELWTGNLELHGKRRTHSGPEPTVLRGAVVAAMESFYGIRSLLRRAKSDGATRMRPARNSSRYNSSAVATVWRAYYDFLSARKKYDASETLVTASEESYNANLESHRHGLATITDLIGAERDLMTARYTLVQNKADLLVSSSAWSTRWRGSQLECADTH